MSGDGVGDPRPSFARYREIMEVHGFRPSKRLGQNFLLDPSLHRAIADAADLSDTDTVLEIGPGLGFLTRELAGRVARLVSVEIDPRLAAIVRAEQAAWSNGGQQAQFELVESDVLGRGDALADPVVAAVGATENPVVVVANLPYSVSGRFLAIALTTRQIRIDRIVVVVQRELAERIAAPSGGRDYGGLSVLAALRGRVEMLRTIPPDVFRPRPRVASALLRIDCRGGRAELPTGFAAFVRVLFGSRRKTLRHALRRLDPPAGDVVLEAWGSRRVEGCGPEQLLELYAAWVSGQN